MADGAQSLVISLDSTLYALESAHIKNIVLTPEITPIPLAPLAIRGVCILEGQLIAVIDGNRLLDESNSSVDTSNETSKMLIINDEKNFALVVDKVLTITKTPKQKLFQYKNETVQYLFLEKLMSSVQIPSFIKTPIKRSEKKEEKVENNGTDRYLICKLGEELFAIPITNMQEIAHPQKLSKIAKSKKEILGFFRLRERSYLCIDLRLVFEIEKSRSPRDERAVIVSNERGSVALIVDAIIDIEDFSHKEVETISKHFEDKKIEGVFRRGQKLISILSKELLGSLIGKESLLDDERTLILDHSLHDQTKSQEFIIFTINNKAYCLALESVPEIVEYIAPTKVPQSNQYLLGAINLRGEITPIISLHKFLQTAEQVGEKSKIILCSSENEQFGVVVDSIEEVVKIEPSNIEKNSDKESLISHSVVLEKQARVLLQISLAYIHKGALWQKKF